MLKRLLDNPLTVAKVALGVDAVLGVLTAGAVALNGLTWSPRRDTAVLFFEIFSPLTALWLAICYGAYRALTSRNLFAQGAFWLLVACNVCSFPVGTGMAVAVIWAWRALRAQRTGPPSP